MKRKVYAMVLTLVLAFSMTACGGSKEADKEEKTKKTEKQVDVEEVVEEEEKTEEVKEVITETYTPKRMVMEDNNMVKISVTKVEVSQEKNVYVNLVVENKMESRFVVFPLILEINRVSMEPLHEKNFRGEVLLDSKEENVDGVEIFETGKLKKLSVPNGKIAYIKVKDVCPESEVDVSNLENLLISLDGYMDGGVGCICPNPYMIELVKE